jgi:hypothetical protein
MSRKSRIAWSIVGLLVWTLAGVQNWWDYDWGDGIAVSQTRIFNMFMMPILALITLGQIWKLLTAPSPSRLLDPYATLTIEESLIVRVLRGLSLVLMIAAGAWGLWTKTSPTASTNISPFMNWFFVGIGLYGSCYFVFYPRQRMTFTPENLVHSQVRPSVIAWEEVADVRAKTMLMSTTLTLLLRESREFRPASLLSRWQRVDKLVLNPLIFGIEPDDLRQAIDLRRNVFTF